MATKRPRVFLIAVLAMVLPVGFVLAAPSLARPRGIAKGLAQCSDGIDNDGDGLVDLGPDPGCTSPSDNSELDTPPQCSDGVDNDGDALTDFPNDPGCDSPADNLESNRRTNPQCSDGLDNDSDGFTDYPNDPGCFSLTDNSEKTH
jgi:hypothetical protein